MSAQHTPVWLVNDEAVQAACQRYAHANGSSEAIVAAVLRAAGHQALLEGVRSVASICALPASNQEEHEFSAPELRRKLRAALSCARAAIAKATRSAAS
jgi:hypothetical protein